MINNSLKSFDAVEVPEYSSSEQRAKEIFQLVVDKSDLGKQKKFASSKRILLIAAIAAAGVITIAASYFTASDALRGHLKEQAPSGSVSELSTLSPLVDKTGKVLKDIPPVTDQGITVTPVAIAGDDSVFTVLFELERVDGGPLALLQEHELEDRGVDDMVFFYWSVTSPSLEKGRIMTHWMDSELDGSRGRILQRFDVYQPVPLGETIHVEVGDLWQMGDMEQRAVVKGRWGFDIPLDYDIVTKEIPVNLPMRINGQKGMLKQVTISPYKLICDFVPEDRGSESLEKIHGYNPEENLALNLRDGSTVFPELQYGDNIGRDGGIDDSSVEFIRRYYTLRAVTDPDSVVEFCFGDDVIPLN